MRSGGPPAIGVRLRLDRASATLRAMPDASLLTEDVRALIGRTSEPVPLRISRRAVYRTMDLYRGDHDVEVADGDPVPGYVLAALDSESDGVPMPDLMPNSLLISNEFEFTRPLRLGEELVSRSRLADISERFGGQFGYSLYFRSDVEFSDPAGEVVARSVRTMMQYDVASARGGEA